MTTSRGRIDVSGIRVDVVRKDIQNLHLGVYPPNGRVRVAAPLTLDDDAVRLAIISRLGWIRRQQTGFAQQDRQSRREIVTGESHYFQGKRYRLRLVEEAGPASVYLVNNTTMVVQVAPSMTSRRRETVLHRWYRDRLRDQLPQLLAKWEARSGVNVAEVRIRKMKTRWGSCNIEARRIWLNLELAKKPQSCLEYILVHEMVHIQERRHGERFRQLMETLMPSWSFYRDLLNRAPLAHEDWRY